MLTLVCSFPLRNGEDFFCYLVLRFLVHSLKFRIFVCGLFIGIFLYFIRLVVKQGDFFLHIKANLSDKYLHMSDIIATFVA